MGGIGSGRPEKWTEKKAQQLIDETWEFLRTTDKISFEKFLMDKGIHTKQKNELAEKYEFFADALKDMKKYVEEKIKENTTEGKYNATFSIFNLKCNHGWVDVQKIEAKHEGEMNINLNFPSLGDDNQDKS